MAPEALAQGRGDPFTVRGVEVDESANSVTQARDRALLVGQRRALDRLLRRLVVAADVERLPRLPNNEMLRLVEAIQVASEKSSATRYIAELIVSFRKDRVRALLRANDVRFAETRAKPALILPVLEEGGERLLFDDANPWREAWLAEPAAAESLMPLMLPLGDLADVATIGPNDAAFGDERRIGQMATRYEVDGVLVVLARLGRDFAADRPTLDISLRRYGGVGARVMVDKFEAEPGETVEALMARAVTALVAGLEEDWKQETASARGVEQRLSVQVPLVDFQDWLTIRQRLLRNAMVRRVEILSIRKSDAQLALDYEGLPSQLQVALAQDDLELREQDGFWLLGQRGRLPGIAAQDVPTPADAVLPSDAAKPALEPPAKPAAE
ncbi:MAG: DUF2066 domain-containing protein [Alphaproteobacteria bacterium]